MTAAFILGINMFIAGIFAVAFAVVAASNPKATGARWIAAGYALGILDIALEYILPMQANPVPVGAAIFLTYMMAISLCVVGVARHFQFAPPWRAMGAIWAWALATTPLIFTLAYSSPWRVALYHLPYFALHMMLVVQILRVRRLQRLDYLLAGIVTISALLHVSRPFIAWQVGTADSAQAYMTTQYAAISQSIGAGMLVAQALVMLLVMMRDRTAEIMARSETDPLSGLLNRRGFNDRAEEAVAEAHAKRRAVVLVAADLDHFKAINDSFGHPAGDAVIAHFAQILRDAAPEKALVSRPGGEEFSVLLLDAHLGDARLYADEARRRLVSADLGDMGIDRPVSASFGVAQMTPGEDFFNLWRRADAALYRAKSGGRNRVSLALGELPGGPSVHTAAS